VVVPQAPEAPRAAARPQAQDLLRRRLLQALFGSSNSATKSGRAAGFAGSKVTGSRTFTGANGTKYAVAPRLASPGHPALSAPPPTVLMPGMHYPWCSGPSTATTPPTVIECRDARITIDQFEIHPAAEMPGIPEHP
jgi:hypothetical protein